MKDSYFRYQEHRKSARERGIEFKLTYAQWLAVWGEQLSQRGRCANQLGMLRFRDQGGYELGNVRIGSPKENRQEAELCAKVRKAQTLWVAQDKFRPTPPAATCWMNERTNVFDEYVESDDWGH